MEKSVFISYSSIDDLEVNNITNAFDSVGIDYWRAPERIGLGSNYAKEIPQGINNCKVFLIVLSSAS